MLVNNYGDLLFSYSRDFEVKKMQRITNCILLKNNQALLLQKPRRGWWVAPGGKMESGESVKDSCVREFREETGIELKNPEIRGIFTFVIKDQDKIVSEWMMFTFVATESEGSLLEESEEGILKWQPIEIINQLPMAKGDYQILNHVISETGILYGTFTYTPDFELIDSQLDGTKK